MEDSREHCSTQPRRRGSAVKVVLAGLLATAVLEGAVAGPEMTQGAEVPLPAADASLVVNEIDVDQPGTDTAEFVELANVGDTVLQLGAYTLELVNGDGAGAEVYRSIALPSVLLEAGGTFVVCGASAGVPNCDLDLGVPSNLIQNGAPDAVAIVLGNTVVDTVSYEGDTGAPYTEGSGAGLVDDGTHAARGLSRFPDGVDSNQNNQDVSPRCVSPGEANRAAESGCAEATATTTATALVSPTSTAPPTGTTSPAATETEDPTSGPPTSSGTPVDTDTPASATPSTATFTPSPTALPTVLDTPGASTTADPGRTATPSPASTAMPVATASATPVFLAVEIEAAWALRTGDRVYVFWRTGAEIDNGGFRIWLEGADGALARLPRNAIPPRGSPLEGATYVYVHHGAPTGRAKYWIEDVDALGASHWHGPVSVPARARARPTQPVRPDCAAPTRDERPG